MKPVSEGTRSAVKMVTIDAAKAGQRIDNFLAGQLKGVPKARIYRGLRKGEVRVNKGRVKQDYKLRAGDCVRIPPWRVDPNKPAPRPSATVLSQLDKAILFEDSSYLVINKHSGWAVHGGSGQSFGVIEALRSLRPTAPYLELAHRLDRDTSGCLLIAKKRSALTKFHAELRAGRVTKRYLALIRGRLPKGWTEISSKLRKSVLRSGERMVQVDPQGKVAETLVRTVDASALASLAQVRIRTGRTHQIRVHLASIDHPVGGDPKYGDDEFNKTCRQWGLKRLFLHASVLAFAQGDSRVEFEAPLAPDLMLVLERLGLHQYGN